MSTTRRAVLVTPVAVAWISPPAAGYWPTRAADLAKIRAGRVAFVAWATSTDADSAAAFKQLENLAPAYHAAEARMNAGLARGGVA